MNTAISTPTTASKVASYGAGHGLRSGRCRCKVKAAAAATASRITESTDYYKVLSLEQSAGVGAEEVRRAYRRLALQYHPDVCPPSRRAESTQLFVELRRAYETLSDPVTRVQYDAKPRKGCRYTASRPRADGRTCGKRSCACCGRGPNGGRMQGGEAATGSRHLFILGV